MPLKLEVVTAERLTYSEDVETVIIPGIEGQLAALPHHTPLMTLLQPGDLVARKGGEETDIAVTGGFIEIRPDRIIVLADAAERAEEIDTARAEAAKKRAQDRLAHITVETDKARAEAALRRAIIRLEVVEKRRRRKSNLI